MREANHGRARVLTDYQRDFVSRVLAEPAPRRIVLKAPPGTGKSTSVADLLHAASGDQAETFEALVIAPKPLLSDWKARLEELVSGPIVLVDAQGYRYLQAEASAKVNPWSKPGIYLTSPEFLSREYRAAEVGDAAWDLVILDEMHQFGNLDSVRGQLAEALWGSSKVRRAVGLTASEVPQFALDDANTEHIQWTLSEIALQLRLGMAPRRSVEVHSFALSAAEKRLFNILASKVEQHQTSNAIERRYHQLLLQQLRSSINAAEPMFRRAASRAPNETTVSDLIEAELAEARELVTTDIDADSVETEDPTRLRFSQDEYEHVFALFEDLDDSKWTTCHEILLDVLQRDRSVGVLVFTEFAATATYLQTSLDLAGLPSTKITGGSTPAKREAAVAPVSSEGGIIIATDASLVGIELGFVNHLIHYDVPRTALRLLQRIGRVERFWRRQHTVYHHFLVDGLAVQRSEVDQLLKAAFGGEGQ